MDESEVLKEPGATAVEAAPAEPPAATEETTAIVTLPAEELRVLREERDALAAEVAGLKDQLLRKLADYDNLRRRAARERLEIIESAGERVVEALLPVLDDFERALGIACADKEYVAGMELIFQRFYAELQKLGLEPVEALDQKFDPNLHHAIEKVESSEAGEDVVVGVFQKGYRFKGKLLRPAIVKVGAKA